MKEGNKIFNAITISILILFAVAIGGTYLSDYLASIDWFGDYEVVAYSDYYKRDQTKYHWGARHYWYNWGMGLLFFTSLARAIFQIAMIVENQNTES